jgi:nucleoside-diphosphate-sugar epimerase
MCAARAGVSRRNGHGSHLPSKQYLITGGAGFIGSHLVEAIIGRGDRVTVLDDLSTGLQTNLETLTDDPRLRFVGGSVTDAELVDRLMAQCDCCLHLASAVGVELVVSDPLHTLRQIVHGTDVVLAAAAVHRPRLVFFSTSEVYGKNSGTALNEDSDRVLGSASKSRWSYAIAKSYGESLAHGYHRQHGTDTVVVRLFNTIGPRQRASFGMVVPRFVQRAIAGDDLLVYGDGSQSRCFLHVADAVAAILAVCEQPDASGRAFNIGNPDPITILALARRVLELTGSDSGISLVPYEQAYGDGFEELGRRSPDITAVSELTGWRPQHTLDEALVDVVSFQRQPANARPAPVPA